MKYPSSILEEARSEVLEENSEKLIAILKEKLKELAEAKKHVKMLENQIDAIVKNQEGVV